MDFGAVLRGMKGDSRRRYAREGWNGKNLWIALYIPTKTSEMSLPYIFMRTAQGDLVPWLASQTDMLAEDWFCVYGDDAEGSEDTATTTGDEVFYTYYG